MVASLRSVARLFGELLNRLDHTFSNLLGFMLWLSTERSNCHFNCATFRLSWVRSLHCLSKNGQWQAKGSTIEMTAVTFLS